MKSNFKGFEVKFYDKVTDNKVLEKIKNLLISCDDDYYPSLSSRFEGNNVYERISNFLETKRDNHFILTWDNENLVGMTTFRTGSTHEEFPDFPVCLIVDNTCISKDYRNMGIAQNMYKYLENDIPEDYTMSFIIRRTWSTNLPQLKAYEKSGFHLIKKVENDRSEGVHTLYYGKELVKDTPMEEIIEDIMEVAVDDLNGEATEDNIENLTDDIQKVIEDMDMEGIEFSGLIIKNEAI